MVCVCECAYVCMSVCVCICVPTTASIPVCGMLNGKSASVQHAASQETRLVVRLELTYDLMRLFEARIQQTPSLPPPTIPPSAGGCFPIFLNPGDLI